jgi:pimeloyl-ACP methyl ester carboxylesterase
MSRRFEDLLAHTLDEIIGREPHYFGMFEVAAAPIDGAVERYSAHPLFRTVPERRLEQALVDGLSYFARRGIRFAEAADGPDPIGTLLHDGIMDAFAADQNLIGLRPLDRRDAPLSAVLAEEYDQHRTTDGRRCFVRREGDIPLLLVIASGIPLTVWSRLLSDRTHRFRIIVMETRCTDIFGGGMRAYSDLTADADDIADMLDRLGIEHVDVLGWCNGGSVAIEAAARRPERVRSLALLSPAVRRVRGVEPSPSRFEESLDRVFTLVAGKPALAEMFSKAIGTDATPTNWEEFADDAAKRTETLLGLPAKDHASALMAPMSDAGSLINYGRRMTSDRVHSIDEALLRLRMPLLLMTGASDGVINNGFIRAALKSAVPHLTHAAIGGGGHHVFHLQYPYLRWLLDCFLGGDAVRPTARVTVEH